MINADYDDFVAAWREAAPPSDVPPEGMFPGLNMMASEVLTYHRLPDGHWAEVSWGYDFHGNRLIGITACEPGVTPWRERTRGVEVFDSIETAAEYLRGLM